ncbi:RNA 3'-terminal phosphate cyclase [Plenodomus tracheiphilus IPT5]|uniref:RNA 3'-terminal phosphate cyclase n=1 Tax=Plenodomus tracheiphilus IPT5 TaxID=1408161 RepID=A0A6A7BEX3_9PLEO|nr:RNA 3'-terminal phosphate cyclase [Plenodomus tracheiphilus IPT5]
MSSSSPPISLEGTTLEGGGQLLRLALSLSSLTSKPVTITNIRGRRHGGGGLKSQHLTCVQWLSQTCNALISGASLKSKDITFIPELTRPMHDKISGKEVHINQTTPGSVNLVFQAILPYILFSGSSEPVQLSITGGTNVSNSPSVDYITQVLLPSLHLIGIPTITSTLHSRGWSQGSTTLGTITYTITPLASPLPAFHLTNRANITSITATIIAPKHTEQHFRDELDIMFTKREARFFSPTISAATATTPPPPEINVTFEDSHHDKRYYILFVATSSTGTKLGRDWLYDLPIRPGKTEKIVPAMVKKVSDDLLVEIEHGGCVDEYLRDQLVVFQALAEGRSRVCGGEKGGVGVQMSLHAKTALWVAGKILAVAFDEDGACEGVGFRPGGALGLDGSKKGLVKQLEQLELSLN